MKRCSKCEAELPLSEFWRNKNRPDGLQCACKGCHNKGVRAYQERVGLRWRNLSVRYGITREGYELMLERQGGACAVCGRTQARISQPRLFDVDHDHRCCPGEVSCGKCVRGLVCSSCNTRIGRIEGHRDWYALAFRYIDSKVNA